MESKVQVKESSFIAPSEATPTKKLWLSPFDQVLANRGHTPLVHLYRANPDATAFFDVVRLKEALAKALVAFYPLAGRLDADVEGRTEIKCNNEGVLFVVACADLGDDLVFKPSPELRRIFIPRIEPSTIILAIQVTFLKCGGVVLGTAVHHAAVDGSCFFHFLQTWSAISRDGDSAAVELPCHDRTLLRPRSPPVVDPSALSVLFPKVTFVSQPSGGPTATEVFTISKHQVATLKRLCGGGAISTFCSVSALVWRCACVARRVAPHARVRLSFPANVRRSLRPPLPDRYFGNALVWLGVTGVARDVALGSSLVSVAGRVAGAVARMDDDVVRSAIDYFELAETDGRPLKGSMPETDLRITSWLGMPVYDVDFGWGKPRNMSRAESVRGGFVYLMDDGPAGESGGGGAVRVVMCMEATNMKTFEGLLYANITNKSAKL